VQFNLEGTAKVLPEVRGKMGSSVREYGVWESMQAKVVRQESFGEAFSTDGG
jgi:hypothetical protein